MERVRVTELKVELEAQVQFFLARMLRQRETEREGERELLSKAL